jgi:integrase
MSTVLLDAAGRRRSPATMPGLHCGRPPRNKGRRYPADPPTVEEIVAVMRQAGTTAHGLRMRGLIVVLWRAGLRIPEALALTEETLDARRGALLGRRGKGGRGREVGIDDWAWEELRHWLSVRVEQPVGPLFCILTGPTRGPPGRPQRHASNYATPRRGVVSGGVSLRTNFGTRTRSRWHAKAYRSMSSNASSATRISVSRPSTCKESTTARSSEP